jgi:acyl-homoserine-lactone acylase
MSDPARLSPRLFPVVITAVILAGCANLTTPTERTVQIQRTAHGIAHIEAPDFEALAFGVAYGQAQDNICQTADHLVTVRGERSRFFGPAGLGLLGLRPLPNDQIDLFIRAHMDDAALAAANKATSAEAKAIAQGYVGGYNRFLLDYADRLPAPCKGQPWVRPMTLGDFNRLSEHVVIQLGVGALAGAVVAARPPQAAARTAPAALVPPSPTADARAALDEFGLVNPGMGSNGWAFGADATANGRGLLLGNPHFPWSGVNRFWQAHLTIPGQLDVMGATIGHSALVVIGFNKDVAWTHTVSTGCRFTLYELTLAPGDPTSYIVDGKPEKMQSKTINIDVRGADGQVTARDTTLWSSRWGPLIVIPGAALAWTATTAYALKDAATLDTRFADTWLGINRAQDVGQIRNAIANIGLPWVNTIAADRRGDALYADASIVPDVNAAQLERCAPGRPAAGLFRTAGIVVLDGSRSDCDWARDPASPVPGLTPIAWMPVLERRDWVQNSNDSFWLSNPAAKLTGFSPLIGAVDTPQNMRTRSGITEIGGRLAGAHGAGTTAKLGVADVEAMLFRNRGYTADVVLDDLLAACSDAPGASSREACAVLGNWDRQNNLDSRGSHVFREWWFIAMNTPGIWRVPFDRANPVNTPAGLNLRDDATRTKVWEALDRAVAAIRTAGFALDAPLREVQAKTTNHGRVPLHGGTGLEGVLNIIETNAVPALTRNGYVPASGTSYLQAVTFDDRGPVADALLTYGQSSQPDSPFAYDQLEAFSRKEMQRLPFHAEDIVRQRVGEVLRLNLP